MRTKTKAGAVSEQVRTLYETIGWTMVDGEMYGAQTSEDLRPVERDYLSKCRLRVLRHLPAHGDRLLDWRPARSNTRNTATFIPQGAEATNSGLALAASQFGIRVPTSGGSWGPAIYVEHLGSRAPFDSIAKDTVIVVEEGNRRAALMDLLGIKAPAPARRIGRASRVLAHQVVGAAEDGASGQ